MLELLPLDLRDQAQSQVRLEQNFHSLRDYVLAQSARKHPENATKARNPADMDIGAIVPDETLEGLE